MGRRLVWDEERGEGGGEGRGGECMQGNLSVGSDEKKGHQVSGRGLAQVHVAEWF